MQSSPSLESHGRASIPVSVSRGSSPTCCYVPAYSLHRKRSRPMPFAVMRGGMGLQHFTPRLLLEERRRAHRCSRSRGGGFFAASSRGSQVGKPEWLREPRIVFACTLSWRILVSQNRYAGLAYINRSVPSKSTKGRPGPRLRPARGRGRPARERVVSSPGGYRSPSVSPAGLGGHDSAHCA